MSEFADELIAEIKAKGGITVHDYMARCNAHYYATRDPLGKDGDFTTAPEISQIFGELIGVWCMDLWTRAGAPDDIALVELGPGRGTLMADLLRAVPKLAAKAKVHFIETSPALRRAQAERVPRATWHDDIDTVPADRPFMLIANEFFDALPILQYVGDAERMISGGRFEPNGDVTEERCLAATDIMAAIAARLANSGGAALVIDYGYTGGETGDTLQAVKGHEHVGPLSAPGESDLTAHVDFHALQRAGKTARGHGPTTQAAFLSALGIGLRAEALMQRASEKERDDIARAVHRLTAPTEMGALFKVMALTGRNWPAPAGFPA
ncbi:MAG: SAM-dependent methyltransferase [Pacificimonas sp.]